MANTEITWTPPMGEGPIRTLPRRERARICRKGLRVRIFRDFIIDPRLEESRVVNINVRSPELVQIQVMTPKGNRIETIEMKRGGRITIAFGSNSEEREER